MQSIPLVAGTGRYDTWYSTWYCTVQVRVRAALLSSNNFQHKDKQTTGRFRDACLLVFIPRGPKQHNIHPPNIPIIPNPTNSKYPSPQWETTVV